MGCFQHSLRDCSFSEITHLGKDTGVLVCQAQGLLVPADVCRGPECVCAY